MSKCASENYRRMKSTAHTSPFLSARGYDMPDEDGYFGEYGGAFVPEILGPALEELTAAFEDARSDPDFIRVLDDLLQTYVGRPTPLTYAARLTEEVGAPKIYLKREDLCHTGAHKINNTMGQVLLARRLGKKRIIAETGAGQHGVATATVCAHFGMQCIVYMGDEDIRRQALNVHRMRILGAEVRPVSSGSRTLKDATNEAIRDWVTNVESTYYIIGSVVGPHPYPAMVREFQAIIGRETSRQLTLLEGRAYPDALLACIGGGSNAIGLFYPFLDLREVACYGVEAAGEGIEARHAATLTRGRQGVLHGALSYLLQNSEGQVQEAHSISAGLDYPGVGPEHAHLKDIGRVTILTATDEEALEAVSRLSRLEGIIPALETAHAIARVDEVATGMSADQSLVICCSGRGDKDMSTIAEYLSSRDE